MKCNICDAGFSEKRDVTSIYEGKKPFKCDFCDYSCSQKMDVNKHIAAVHEGKKPFQCFNLIIEYI